MSHADTAPPTQPTVPSGGRAAQDQWISGFLERPVGGGIGGHRPVTPPRSETVRAGAERASAPPANAPQPDPAAQQERAKYDATRAAAEKLLTETAHLPHADIIAPDLAKIRTTHLIEADKKAHATPPEYEPAIALLDGIAAECATARGIAQTHGRYATALAAAQQLVATLTDPVIAADKVKIQTDLIDAAITKVKPPARDYAGAMPLLDRVAAACDAAKKIAASHAEYDRALADIERKLAALTSPVAATEVAVIRSSCIQPAKVLAAPDRRDYPGAMALLAQATTRWETADLHVRRYAAGLTAADGMFTNVSSDAKTWIDDWKRWGSPTLLGVSDVLIDIKTKQLDAGKARAAAGDYAAAMPLLEQVTTRLPDVVTKLRAYKAYWVDRDPKWQAYTAAETGAPTPTLLTAVRAIKTDIFDPGVNAAKTGDYVQAKAAMAPFHDRFDALGAVITAWNAAATPIAALSGGDIATDRARMQTDRLNAATTLITGNDMRGAVALLAKVPAECAHIAEYGTALTAAKAELAKLPKPGAAADIARIQRDYLDAARTRATAWDYVGAIALLKKVPAECTAAATVATQQAAASSANAGAQAQANAHPDAAVAEIAKLLTALERHAQAGKITTDIAAVRAELDKARAAIGQKKPQDAKAPLAEAGKLALAAQLKADRWTQFETLHTAANARINGLPANAAAEKTRIQTDILQVAVTDAGAGDLEKALQVLSGVEPACAQATVIAARATAYAAALATAQAELASLTDAFLTPDKQKIQTDLLNVAATRATAHDYDAADGLLRQVKPKCDTAKEILRINGDYTTKLAAIKTTAASIQNNINWIASHGLAVRPEFATQLTDINTNHINAATTAVTGRTPGDLAVMQRALKLIEDGIVKADKLLGATADYALLSGEKTKAQTAVTTLKAHKGADGVRVEITAVEKLLTDAAALATAGQYQAAMQVYQETQTACASATKIADQQGPYDDELKAAEARAARCKAAVDGLRPPVAPITAAMQAITRSILSAKEAAAGRDFGTARPLLAQIDGQCVSVEAMVTQQGQYATALTAAEADVAKLTDASVADDVKRIRQDMIEPAKTKAGTPDYTAALALLAKVKPACDAATAIATGSQQAATARAGAQGKIDGAAADPASAATAVQQLLTGLLSHPQASAIKDLTDRIAALIQQARSGAPAVAKASLTQAADLCTTARQMADRQAALAAALTTAENAVAGLTSPVVRADRDKITRDRIDAAKTAVQPPKRDYNTAMGLLDGVQVACNTAQALVGQDATYQAALTPAQAAVTALGSLTPALSGALAAEAAKIQTDRIDAAKALVASPARDYAGAQKLLASVAGECKSLTLKNKMLAPGGAAPGKPDFAALMNEPGGTAQLDKMIASLPDDCPRAMMKAAIEARFGLDSFQEFETDASLPAGVGKSKSLKKIYELISKCPGAANTPSLKKIERYGGGAGEKANVDRGSYYQESGGTIVLSCGRSTDADPQPLSKVSLALPNVDPDAEMVPDSVVPAPKYFDWTTLHEVGHAIDDKKQFMAGKAGNPQFGGWQVYGTNVLPVAQAIAGQCKFTGRPAEAYLAAYLLKSKAPIPAAPGGRADWDDCRKQAEGWCDAIRVDKELWEKGGDSSTYAIGGRVYHEAYGGVWISYALAARSKGITGYQFRAPGEWLAELYAAYRSQKLKPNHPAVTWLATL